MIRSEVRDITPDDARGFLARNTYNRPILKRRVQRYAEEMMAGAWRLSGDSVKIAEDGTILDGQHRLLACVESGTTFRTLVVEGLDRSVFDVIDTHAIRRPSDALHIRGLDSGDEQCVALLAASLAWIYRHEINGMAGGNSRVMSNHESLELLDRHPGVRDFVRLVSGSEKLRAFGKPSLTVACYYLFSRRDEKMAAEFFHKFATGANLQDDEPVYLLRERLIRDKGSITKLPPVAVAALFFKAWNLTVQGRKIRNLVWNPEREKFPALADAPVADLVGGVAE